MSLIDTIPDQYRDGLTKLSELKEPDFKNLIDKLNAADFVSSIIRLSEFVCDIDGEEYESVDKILNSVGSLFEIIKNENIIDTLIENISSLAVKEKLIADKNEKILYERVKKLLEIKQLYYAYKAEDLSVSYENIFIKTKIVTDIRPIFEVDVTRSPEAGIILHNLIIHYQPNEVPFHKDISILLTSDDIKVLQDALDRAQEKEVGLKSFFEKTDMKNLTE